MKNIPACLLILVTALMLAACGGDEKVRTGSGAKPKEAQAEKQSVALGAGGVTGIYYPAGSAIARIVNSRGDIYNIRCTVQATGGSIFNVNAVLAGDLEFGLVQSDRQYQAVKGVTEWRRKGPQADLRAVFSLQAEPVTLVAAVDAGIRSIGDLRGKRVDIGSPGTGRRRYAVDALENAGINYKSDLEVENLKAGEVLELFEDKRIDAFFDAVEHPSSAIRQAVSGTRKVAFIPLTGLDRLLKKYPYYTRAFIPAALYPGSANEGNVQTFGVRATLVTAAKVPDNVVYAMTKAVFENFDEFRNLQPALAALTREDMLKGLTAPIHPGAMKYYREAGLK